MRKDVLEALKKAERMRRLVQRVETCLAQLDPDEQLIVDILLDEEGWKNRRICDAFGVTKTTAYKYIDHVLTEISNIFRDHGVEIGVGDGERRTW